MKPFNLEEALAGKPVVTRNGQPVKIAGYNPNAGEYQRVVGWVNFLCENWNEKGIYYYNGSGSLDLFMATEKKEGWVNIYKDRTDKFCSTIYFSKEESKEKIIIGQNYISTIKIEWEE